MPDPFDVRRDPARMTPCGHQPQTSSVASTGAGLAGSVESQTGAPFVWNFNPSFSQSFSNFSQPQNNRWKTEIGLLLVPFQRRFSQYKFAVESISLHVEEQSAPEL
jgi:hypothetical protein